MFEPVYVLYVDYAVSTCNFVTCTKRRSVGDDQVQGKYVGPIAGTIGTRKWYFLRSTVTKPVRSVMFKSTKNHSSLL